MSFLIMLFLSFLGAALLVGACLWVSHFLRSRSDSLPRRR